MMFRKFVRNTGQRIKTTASQKRPFLRVKAARIDMTTAQAPAGGSALLEVVVEL